MREHFIRIHVFYRLTLQKLQAVKSFPFDYGMFRYFCL